MIADRHNRVSELFLAVCELNERERTVALEQACADDPSLKREVEALLAQDVRNSHFLEAPPRAETALNDLPSKAPGVGSGGDGGFLARAFADAAEPPAKIGSYSIRSVLGQGGMGMVYLAEQQQPHRLVALKVIKPGMDSGAVIARFETERQALAVMDHPNVAKVFDAGTTELGRPYFSMEYVDGIPVTDYCADHGLALSERLGLFVQVCEAVQHAHQKGVIHRDLKPSNILVTVKDGKPVPQVIDFGIAKAIDQRLSSASQVTEHGQLLGTPAYMSPEQAVPDTQDIDTRSDIYSLGVVLYELLTGSIPLDPQFVRRSSLDDIRRAIRDVTPPRPSVRASSLPQTPATLTADVAEAVADIEPQRPVSRAPLSKHLRGDLDWITMKALEKDRSRRYATAADLAADVGRHLRHEVVLAGRPSAWYRCRKFAQRNRSLAAGAVAVTFGLVLAAASASVALVVVNRARSAEAVQAQVVQSVNDFVTRDLLAAASPDALGPDAKIRDALDRATENLKAKFVDAPLVEAAIRHTAGTTYAALGQLGDAAAQLESASTMRRENLGAGHPDTLATQLALGDVYGGQGRHAEALETLSTALTISRHALGDAHSTTQAAMVNLGAHYFRLGRYDEAESLLVPVLDARRRLLGDHHADTLIVLGNAAQLRWAQGRQTEGLALASAALDIGRVVHGDGHWRTVNLMSNLAGMYLYQRRFADAEPLLQQALELNRALLGADHPRTLKSIGNLAVLMDELQRYDEAESFYREALRLHSEKLGPEHPDTLVGQNNLAAFLADRERFEEAEKLHREILGIRQRVLTPDHPDTLTSLNNLAFLYYGQGRLDQALPLLAEAHQGCVRVLGSNHPDTLDTATNLAVVLKKLGNLDEAERVYTETLVVARRELGEEHSVTLSTLSNLAALYHQQENYDKAEPLLRDVLAARRRQLPAGDLEIGRAAGSYGAVLTKLKRYEESEDALLEAHQCSQSAEGPRHSLTRTAIDNLIFLYEAWHVADPDKGYDQRVAEWREKLAQ